MTAWILARNLADFSLTMSICPASADHVEPLMEENEYRDTYQGYNTLPCVFERGILVRCIHCEQAQRLYIAEREAVACRSSAAHVDCETLIGLLRKNARFVLRQARVDQPLAHAKEVRVQCGGIQGLEQVLNKEQDLGLTSDNIYALVREARSRFDTLQRIPLQEVVKCIASHQSRRRRNPANHPSGPTEHPEKPE